jgi:DHA1 family bicyclomycin/chloramphenicol resistance-like MFS transporter
LKGKLLIAFIVVVSAFPPLSTDLALPALPEIAEYFHVNNFSTNLTMVVFFLSFSLSMLIWGPLSDKYGRKPMLFIGFGMYFIGSILCGMAGSIELLIFFRVFQGIGGGSSFAISTAIVRDVFVGRAQESVLAVVQSMAMICPVAAPILGAFLQRFTTWQGIFFAQAILGLIVLVGTIFFKETIPQKMDVNVIGALARLWPVLSHGKFALMTITFSLPSFFIMAWVSSSAYIYENFFGFSSQTYSYFFAAVAVGAVTGPIAYMGISRGLSRYTILVLCFSEMVIAGILIAVFGTISPVGLMLMLIPTSFSSGTIRPPTTFLMLNNKQGDTGSAAALIGCISTINGTLGMLIASFFTNYIMVIGVIAAITGAICLIVWLTVFRHTRTEEN